MIGKTNAIGSAKQDFNVFTTIRINQTITDPASMITLIEDTGGIDYIRNNSHRYLGKYTGDGEMTICQLNDYDSNYYKNGTIANLTTNGCDVWMKLPKFYYRAIAVENDIWDITFACGNINDSSYKVWEGNELIGVYETYTETKSFCRSDVVSTGSVSQAKFKTDARNRGDGYTCIKWKHHCIMAFLFYAYYRHTNSQLICGFGTDSLDKTCGQTNTLGMRDTIGNGGNGDNQSINFWGLENWWGNKYEWIDDIVVNTYAENEFRISEELESYRTIYGVQGNGFASKFKITSHLDLLPTEINGSSTTGFCDIQQTTTYANTGCRRSGRTNINYGGVSCLLWNTTVTSTSENNGSRLAFCGNIIEEANPEVFKEIPITNA